MKQMLFGVVAVLAGAAAWPVWALDHVVVEREGREQEVSGKVLVEAEDGGLLLLARDGSLWAVQPDELAQHSQDDDPFQPYSKEELGERLLAEMPAGFKVHATAHYVICYNTSSAYAEWVGALFERLYRAFDAYWQHQKFELAPAEFPLCAIVFDGPESYARHARPLLGEAALSIKGYYHLASNRVIMYDLTGVEGPRGKGEPESTAAHITRLLSEPGAELNVATIIHEATHQLAYNRGLHSRSAKTPLWVSEGLAVYFEQPDLESSRGWRTIGAVNRERLLTFKQYLRKRPADSLVTLVSSDARFIDPKQALAAYAEAWALNYFLLKSRTKEFVEYLGALAAQEPMADEPAEERLARFKQAFGDDLPRLDAEFLRYMQRVR